MLKNVFVGLVCISLSATLAQAGYPLGYQWNFQSQFNTSQNPAPDDQGSTGVWEYRYGMVVDQVMIQGYGLMGAVHSWETPKTWQLDGNGHNAKIGQKFVQVTGSEPLQIRWISPISGTVNVMVKGAGKGGNSDARFRVGQNEIDNLYDNNLTGDLNWSITGLTVNAGDQILCTLGTIEGGEGGDLVTYQNFNFVVSIPSDGAGWNYQTQFSTTANPASDGQGNTGVWEYRYGWDGNGLMGCFHGWETPATWQIDDNAHQARIGQSYIRVTGGEALQIRWVSPVTGKVNAVVLAQDKGGSYELARFAIKKNGVDLYDSLDTATGEFTWAITDLDVTAGDVISTSFWGWGLSADADVTYQNFNMIVSQPMSRLPGDANGDTMVDVGDLGILAANYGGSGKTWAQGDFNGDGLVDVGDLGILAAHYGEGVPNPTTADWNADYAKAFATTSTNGANDASTEVSTSACSGLGLPLITGLVLMGLMLVKLEE